MSFETNRAAVIVDGLSKQYAIGGATRYRSIRESVSNAVMFRRRRTPGMFWALDDVSFTLSRGQVLGVIGRNGAGKSTLLKILSRITAPDRGTARIYGRVGSLLEVGTGFHSELTGRENIFLNGAILGMTRAEILKHFDEIVEFAEVGSFLDTPVKHYSSGMVVRLAFSVAAHLTPEILFFDEVLAVGDITFQQKSIGKMTGVAGEGRSIIFVSHELSQIRRLCDTCLWLDRGKVRAYGATADVVSRYEYENTRHQESARESSAVLVSWSVQERGQAPSQVLDSDGPFSLTVSVNLPREKNHCHLRATLKNGAGTLLWGHEAQNVTVPAGESEFVYEFSSLPIAPGPYTWNFALYDVNGLVDSLQSTQPMFVRTTPYLKTADSFTGMLNLPCRFEVREL